MRLEIGYPDTEAQLAILAAGRQGHHAPQSHEPILSLAQLAQLQDEAACVHVDTRVQCYLVELCERTRNHATIALGVSPRGMLIWQHARRRAGTPGGRDFVTPEDIQAVAEPVLGVRLVCRVNPNRSSNHIIASVEVPTYR